MSISVRVRALILAAGVCAAVSARAPVNAASRQLKYVVIISRHGVRSPTWDKARLNQYSTESWPEWGVAPGELTPHGRTLMAMMGAYYRAWLADEGITGVWGCGTPSRVYVWADGGQRTVETGRALGSGLSPDCPPEVHSARSGAQDPLFDPIAAGLASPDVERSAQAVRDRLAAKPTFAADQRAAFETLRHLLVAGDQAPVRTIPTPASITVTAGARGVEVTEALATASTFSENFLLEYANGFEGHDLGWGRLNAETLHQVLQLHGSYADLTRRTRYIARARGSHLLARVLRSMEQAVTGHSVPDALSAPDDVALVLAGHDTNQSNLSGMLDLSWRLPGYQPDETPPGGALIFSLWQDGTTRQFVVTTEFVAQSLEQMRQMQPLTLAAPPEREPVLVPGCGDTPAAGCAWPIFERVIEQAIDPQFTSVRLRAKP